MSKYTPETGTLKTASLDTSNAKVLVTTGVALGAAALILATFVLPAEFNRDPLGLGQTLGLMGLSEPSTSTVETVRKEPHGFHEDSVTFQLLPFEYVEYKYQAEDDSAILYSWTATGAVSYDFHGEPADGPEDAEASYSMGKSQGENGAFTAPFNGIHGWFWENRSTDTVTVTLQTAGFYTESLEFRDGHVTKEVLSERP